MISDLQRRAARRRSEYLAALQREYAAFLAEQEKRA